MDDNAQPASALAAPAAEFVDDEMPFGALVVSTITVSG
jgi:hypothetical protein